MEQDMEMLMHMDKALLSLIMGLTGYLLGSVMFAYLLPKTMSNVDVRKYGDGNPGAYNVHLCSSKPLAFFCAGLDILKGFLPVFIAYTFLGLTGWQLFLPMVGPVLGHLFPGMLHFRGGKGICTAFGVMMGLLSDKLYALMWAAFILVLLPIVHDHRRLILISSAIFVPLCFLVVQSIELNMCVASVAVLVLSRHLKETKETAGKT